MTTTTVSPGPAAPAGHVRATAPADPAGHSRRILGSALHAVRVFARTTVEVVLLGDAEGARRA